VAVIDAEEIARNISFTRDQHGRTTAVVITPELWRQILDVLEDAEDHALVGALKDRLAAGPVAAGALRWDALPKD
jgi:hypothetical protein